MAEFLVAHPWWCGSIGLYLIVATVTGLVMCSDGGQDEESSSRDLFDCFVYWFFCWWYKAMDLWIVEPFNRWLDKYDSDSDLPVDAQGGIGVYSGDTTTGEHSSSS